MVTSNTFIQNSSTSPLNSVVIGSNDSIVEQNIDLLTYHHKYSWLRYKISIVASGYKNSENSLHIENKESKAARFEFHSATLESSRNTPKLIISVFVLAFLIGDSSFLNYRLNARDQKYCPASPGVVTARRRRSTEVWAHAQENAS